MPLFPLCREDPLLAALHDLFAAHAVRVPDARVRPLCVVAQRGSRCFFRGSLLPLLADARPLGLQPAETAVPELAGRRSRRVAFDLGAHIMRGFLKGFGLPSAELAGALAGAAYLRFSFAGVRRISLDVNALGWALAGRRLDPENPAAAIFFARPRSELLLIDSALVSGELSIAVGGDQERRLSVDVDALRKIVAGLDGRLDGGAEDELTMRFAHPADLTFAFSCVRLLLDGQGRITSLPPDLGSHLLGEPLGAGGYPQRAQIGERPGLLIWDPLR